MALFGGKKNTTAKKSTAKKAVKRAESRKTKPEGGYPNTEGRLFRYLREPRITEKGTLGIANSVYVFTVPDDATKIEVRKAVEAVYKVSPRKVNIVRIAPRAKVSRVRGIRGTKKGSKKAYVYLGKDERIELM